MLTSPHGAHITIPHPTHRHAAACSGGAHGLGLLGSVGFAAPNPSVSQDVGDLLVVEFVRDAIRAEEKSVAHLRDELDYHWLDLRSPPSPSATAANVG